MLYVLLFLYKIKLTLNMICKDVVAFVKWIESEKANIYKKYTVRS